MKILQKDNVSIDEMQGLTKETLRTLNNAGQRAILKHMTEHPNEVASFTGETTCQNSNPESKEIKEKLTVQDLVCHGTSKTGHLGTFQKRPLW
jgi:hypothetical protein